MTHVTCRLTAKNRDQLRHPTLGNRVWATFTYLHSVSIRTHQTRDGSLAVNSQPIFWYVVVITGMLS